jgi:hypothetical protein
MIQVIAVLCSLASPSQCHEETVTTSDFAQISLTSCFRGAERRFALFCCNCRNGAYSSIRA